MNFRVTHSNLFNKDTEKEVGLLARIMWTDTCPAYLRGTDCIERSPNGSLAIVRSIETSAYEFLGFFLRNYKKKVFLGLSKDGVCLTQRMHTY